VSGYKVTTDSNGQNTWTLLGKRDPNTPQMFYPIESNVTVKYGDSLVIFVAKISAQFLKNILNYRLLDAQWPVTGTSQHKLGKLFTLFHKILLFVRHQNNFLFQNSIKNLDNFLFQNDIQRRDVQLLHHVLRGERYATGKQVLLHSRPTHVLLGPHGPQQHS
jgi:hypothetical protein